MLSTPAIREIRRNYPFAHITLVVRDAVYPMAELCPYVNEIIPFKVAWVEGHPHIDGGVIGVLKYITDFAEKYLWKRRYSLCFCLNYWVEFVKGVMTYLSGARQRVGYLHSMHWRYSEKFSETALDIGHLFFTHPVINPPEIISDVARDLYLLKYFGLNIRSMELELWYDAQDFYDARKLLEGFAPNRIKVVTAIGANDYRRVYPVDKWLIVFSKIIENGGAVVILGGPAEIESAKFLQENLPDEYVKNLVSQPTGWRVDSAIIAQADIYVGNNTGAKDVAAASRVPIVTLAAITRHITDYAYFPPGANIIVSGAENADIASINPEEIVSAYNEMVTFIKFSRIKRTATHSFIRAIDQISELGIGSMFEKS